MLTEHQARNAAANSRPYKLSDFAGLYLLVTPRGSKLWRLKYRLAGIEKCISLGIHPGVSLALARQRRDHVKAQLRVGIDPMDVRRADRAVKQRRKWRPEISFSFCEEGSSRLRRACNECVCPSRTPTHCARICSVNPRSRGPIMPLSETVIRHAKPGTKAIKMFDGRGLYLLLSPSGSRWWRFKYRIDGREKLISLGIYPDVPLKLARDRREESRRQLAAGIDPGAKRQAEKAAMGDTFEAIAREWLALQEPKLAPATFAKAEWTLQTFIFPGLGNRPISKITAPDLAAALLGPMGGLGWFSERSIAWRQSERISHSKPRSAGARMHVEWSPGSVLAIASKSCIFA